MIVSSFLLCDQLSERL